MGAIVGVKVKISSVKKVEGVVSGVCLSDGSVYDRYGIKCSGKEEDLSLEDYKSQLVVGFLVQQARVAYGPTRAPYFNIDYSNRKVTTWKSDDSSRIIWTIKGYIDRAEVD